MSEHELPKTYDEAIAKGYKPVADLNKFVTETLGLTMDKFNAKSHEFAADPNQVNCTHAPPDTTCCRRCVTDSHGKRVGVVGKCKNGGCDMVYGPC